MTMALTAKNKLAFVDGSLSQPAIDTGAEFQAWVRCNNMILSWILNSVSKEIAASAIYIDTCHGMWLDLKERFSQKNLLILIQIALPGLLTQGQLIT